MAGAAASEVTLATAEVMQDPPAVPVPKANAAPKKKRGPSAALTSEVPAAAGKETKAGKKRKAEEAPALLPPESAPIEIAGTYVRSLCQELDSTFAPSALDSAFIGAFHDMVKAQVTSSIRRAVANNRKIPRSFDLGI